MKELSIEEKAKRYDDAIINGSRLLECGEITRANYENIFPELKESEGERIVKELLTFFRESIHGGHILTNKEYDSWIAWLEKQGDHAKFRDSIQIGDQVTRNQDGVLVNLSQLKRVAKPADAEKVEPKFKPGDTIKCKYDDRQFTIKSVDLDKGTYTCTQEGCGNDIDYADKEFELVEQKPTDKVEPKFKIGDEIIKSSKNSYPVHSSTDDTICKVAEIHDTCYILDTKEGKIQEPFEWQDYYKLVEQKPTEDSCKNSDDITTEEKDRTEYKKGFECGKQRVLKYPEDFGLCKKIAWSEEDKRIIDGLISICDEAQDDIPRLSVRFSHVEALKNWLTSLKDRVQPQTKQEWSEDDENRINRLIAYFEDKESFTAEDDVEYANWLKSLRPHSTWKPSEEQIEALLKLEEMHVLEHEKNQENAHLYMVVKSIREQLLKLREE